MNLRFASLLVVLLTVYFRSDAAILTVRTNGVGTVTPDLNGQDLLIGKIYTITAKPGKGYVFSNWTGSVLTAIPKLSFIMQENMILEANFVSNPFTARAGKYQGVFLNSTNASAANSGFVSLNVNNRGGYSGYILLSTNKLPFTGKFDISGATTPVFRANTALGMRLALDVSTNDGGVSGFVTNGLLVSQLSALRGGFLTSTNPATNFMGKYTLVIPGPGTNNAAPMGAGYATAVVSKKGKLNLKGSLADGRAINLSVSMDRNGEWPFFVTLTNPRELLLGWVAQADLPFSDLSGTLLWVARAETNRAVYRSGFTNLVNVIGSRYVVPARQERILDITNGVLTVSGANLISPTTNLFELKSNNSIVDAGVSHLGLSFNKNNGVFKGKIQPAGVTLPLTFQGAVLQKARAGAGYFLTTNLSGAVFITDLGPPQGPLAVSFTASATNGAPAEPITFNATFSAPVATSFWDFGDGTFVTNAPTATHSWAAEGDYIVTLTGFNFTAPAGASASTTIQIVSTNPPPIR